LRALLSEKKSARSDPSYSHTRERKKRESAGLFSSKKGKITNGETKTLAAKRGKVSFPLIMGRTRNAFGLIGRTPRKKKKKVSSHFHRVKKGRRGLYGVARVKREWGGEEESLGGVPFPTSRVSSEENRRIIT